eukprot:1141225-Pelagomonas_calceolata.AAC.1
MSSTNRPVDSLCNGVGEKVLESEAGEFGDLESKAAAAAAAASTVCAPKINELKVWLAMYWPLRCLPNFQHDQHVSEKVRLKDVISVPVVHLMLTAHIAEGVQRVSGLASLWHDLRLG